MEILATHSYAGKKNVTILNQQESESIGRLEQ